MCNVMKRIINDKNDLIAWLERNPLSGSDCVVYRLKNQKSRLQKELLLCAIRRQSILFQVGFDAVPADIEYEASTLLINIEILNWCNEQISEKCLHDPSYGFKTARDIILGFSLLDNIADDFEQRIRNKRVTAEIVLHYFDTCVGCYEMSNVKYGLAVKHMTDRLLDSTGGGIKHIEDLIKPTRMSLFNRMRRLQLDLAIRKCTDKNHKGYKKSLAEYIQQYGFLEHEDIDVLGIYNNDYFDEKITEIVGQYGNSPTKIRKALEEMESAHKKGLAGRYRAKNVLFLTLKDDFKQRLLLMNYAALLEIIREYEDENRYQKIRFLHNISGLMKSFGMDVLNEGMIQVIEKFEIAEG